MSPHHVDLRQEQPRPAASGATGDHSGQRPVIVIIPGAWHHPVHYNLLAKGLRQLGFEFEVVELSTMGEPEAIVGKTHHDDVKIVRDAIQPHLDAGREVVLVPHSYGGFVATDVAAGCTVEERRDAAGGDDGLEVGGRGGVKAVVYMASPVTSEKGVGLTAACELVRGEYPILIESFVNVSFVRTASPGGSVPSLLPHPFRIFLFLFVFVSFC